jgi:hypothetical protein
MVALVVSSLLVGMILAIFSRMSLAYRGQQQIAGVQQVLAAARATIEVDAKQAGLEMPQGFKFASDAGTPPPPRSPLRVFNSNTGPDQIMFFYGDPTTQARVTVAVVDWSPTPIITVDSSAGFIAGERVVLSTITGSIAGLAGGAAIATYDACVVAIQSIAGTNITLSTAAPWGRGDTSHCTKATTQTMVYKFVARAYRIDTSTVARAGQGPLQLSPTGALLQNAGDNWTDLALGFTDIQTAVRTYDTTDAADLDADGDATRDWYSGPDQDGKTSVAPGTVALIQMSISLVARTDRDIEGISTAATPELQDPLRVNNNSRGDRPSIALPSAIDDALKGSRIYRYTTFQVDLRNLGVGR